MADEAADGRLRHRERRDRSSLTPLLDAMNAKVSYSERSQVSMAASF